MIAVGTSQDGRSVPGIFGGNVGDYGRAYQFSRVSVDTRR